MSDAREQARHIIDTVQAYMDGKQIQKTARFEIGGPWKDDHAPNWDWCLFIFRVKPEERKPREWDSWENNGDIIGHPVGENVTDEMLVALGWKRIRVVEVLPGNRDGVKI